MHQNKLKNENQLSNEFCKAPIQSAFLKKNQNKITDLHEIYLVNSW